MASEPCSALDSERSICRNGFPVTAACFGIGSQYPICCREEACGRLFEQWGGRPNPAYVDRLAHMKEREWREHNVRMIEQERGGEIEFLKKNGVKFPSIDEIMSDDELLAELRR